MKIALVDVDGKIDMRNILSYITHAEVNNE